MITGTGTKDCDWGRCVEEIYPDGKQGPCTPPDLPAIHMRQHTQSGVIVCGGWNDNWPQEVYYDHEFGSCYTFIDGVWITSHKISIRYGHSSWFSKQYGVILMGGHIYHDLLGYSYDHVNTTEMLTITGKSKETFKLKYNTT